MDPQFKKNLMEFVKIRKQLSDIQADVKILRDKKKELENALKSSMSQADIDVVNSSEAGVKVTHKISVKKGTMGAKAMKIGIKEFYEKRGDPNTFELLMTFLEESRVQKESETLSVRNL